MGTEWIFISTILAIFIFCLARWISFGFRFGGNIFAYFLRGLLIFLTSISAIIGLHFFAMDLPFISRFYYDPDFHLASVTFVSITCAVFVITVSEFLRKQFQKKRLKIRHSEIDLIGTENQTK